MKQTIVSSLIFAASITTIAAFSGGKLPSKSVRSNTARDCMTMRWGLKGGTANKITGVLEDGVMLRDTVPFEIRGFSLPLVVFSVGALLTASSFFGYVLNQDGGDGSLSSLGFVYGTII